MFKFKLEASLTIYRHSPPDFTPGFLTKPEHSYIAPFFHNCWLGGLPGSKQIQMITVADSHAFIMNDQPDKLGTILKEFMEGTLKPYPPVR